MTRMAPRPTVKNSSAASSDQREEKAIEKAAELFRRIYGPAIKELETK